MNIYHLFFYSATTFIVEVYQIFHENNTLEITWFPLPKDSV